MNDEKYIYKVCRTIRMYKILTGVLMIACVLFIYFIFLKGDFEDLFYGINLLYLMLIVIGISIVVYNGILILFNVDAKRNKCLAEKQGITIYQLENDLRNGNIFYQKGTTEAIYISKQYGLIITNGKHHVIRTNDITKLGIDFIGVDRSRIEKMNCLMRDGSKYSLIMRHDIAMQLANYLTNISQNL